MNFQAGQLFAGFNQLFTLYLVFPGIVFLGLYLTFRLRGVQVSKLWMSFATLFKKGQRGEGNISHYQAIASVLASNFGTGNISGMAIALATGGPGALVWMWVMAFLGSAIQFANCLLGVKYRKKRADGRFVGGPMYYLSEGLGWKKISMLFSVFVILAAFGVGNFVQINSVALPLSTMGVAPWISGVVLAVLVGIVVIGGAQRIAHVSSAVVPVMAFLYLGSAFYILFLYSDQLLPAFQLMFKSSMGLGSVAGGAAGFTLMKALTSGFDRAIFATDAGTGTVPILQSEAKTKHPVIDGVVTLVAPFLVMIVCTTTALTLIVTGSWTQPELQSTNMVLHAFKTVLGEKWGVSIVLTALFLFGYTTTIAWATCLERAVGFLWGVRPVRFFQLLYIALVPVGAILNVDFVWIFADCALTAMLVLNVIGVAGLSREVIFDTRAYFRKPSIAKAD